MGTVYLPSLRARAVDADRSGPGAARRSKRLLSGPGLARDYADSEGRNIGAADVAKSARDGEAAGVAAVDKWVRRVGRSLAAVINIVDPEVAELGGGLSDIADVCTMVPKVWENSCSRM